MMTAINAKAAKAGLYGLIDDVAISHSPIVITGKLHNAVLISEEDWKAIHETLYLVSIPNMRESILDGMKIPLDECDTKLDW